MDDSDDEDIKESSVECCIKCGNKELKRTTKAIFCTDYRCQFRITRGDDKDVREKLQNAASNLEMKYCCCGEELMPAPDDKYILSCMKEKVGCGERFDCTESSAHAKGTDTVPADCIKYCVLCKFELKRIKKSIKCSSSTCKFKIACPEGDANVQCALLYKPNMKFCYECGKELVSKDSMFACLSDEGCGMKLMNGGASAVAIEEDREIPAASVKYCILCKLKVMALKNKLACCRASACKFSIKREHDGTDVRRKLVKLVGKHGMRYCFQCGGEVTELGDKDVVRFVCSNAECDLHFTSQKLSSVSAEVRSCLEESVDDSSVKSKPRLGPAPVEDTTTNMSNSGEGDHPSAGEKFSDTQRPDTSHVQLKEQKSPEHAASSPDQSYDQQNGSPRLSEKPEIVLESNSGQNDPPKTSGAVQSEQDYTIVVPHEDVQDIHMAIKVVREWKSLGKKLGFDDVSIAEIAHHGDPSQCKMELLKYWFLSDVSLDVFIILASALEELNYPSCASQVRKLFQERKHQWITTAENKKKDISTGKVVAALHQIQYSEDHRFGELMLPVLSGNASGKPNVEKFIKKRKVRYGKSYPVPLKECVRIVFHALIPKATWGWDKKSKIFVRFGVNQLGEWKFDCGDFAEKSYLKDSDVQEVELIFYIPETVLNQEEGIPYKYVVYSSKVFKKELSEWENIPSPEECTDRYLVVSQHQRKAKETFHQYDAIVLPHAPTEAWYQRMGQWLSRKSKAVAAEGYSVAMNIYFKPFNDDFLSHSNGDPVDVIDVGERMANVFCGLCYSWYCSNSREPWPRCPSDVTFVLDWAGDVCEKLLERAALQQEKSPSAVKLRLRCYSIGVALIHFLRKSEVRNYQNKLKFAMVLLKLLAPTASTDDSGKKKCCEFEFTEQLQENIRSVLPDVIKQLCCTLLNLEPKPDEATSKEHWEWICGVPLLHYLSRDITAFEAIDFIPGPSTWNKVFRELPVRERMLKFPYGERFVEDAFEFCLSHGFFKLDYLALWTITYPCSMEVFPKILQYAPSAVTVLTVYLEIQCGQFKHPLEDSQFEKISKVLHSATAAITRLESKTEDTDRLSPFQYRNIMKPTAAIFSHLKFYCNGSDRIDFVCTIFTLFLRALAGQALHEVSGDEMKACTGLEGVQDDLSKWLESASVIGSSKFAKGVSERFLIIEMKIWDQLLHVLCPEKVRNRWNTAVSWIITKRIQKLSPTEKLKLIKLKPVSMLTSEYISTDVFTKPVLVEISKGTLQDSNAENLLSAFFDDEEELSYGELLDAYLVNHFSKGNRVTLESVLKWHLWPSYLKIYVHHLSTIAQDTMDAVAQVPDNHMRLSVESQELCQQACTVFFDICQKLFTGTVLMLEMQTLLSLSAIPQKTDAILLLDDQPSDSVSQKPSVKFTEVESRFETLYICSRMKDHKLPSFDSLVMLYRRRKLEYEEYVIKKRRLLIFASHCSSLNQDGCKRIRDMVTKSQCVKLLSEICTNTNCDNSTEKFHFHLEAEIEQILAPFEIMMSKKETHIFNSIWEEKMSVCTSYPLELKQIRDSVWEPAFKHCRAILMGLNSLCISLQKVKRFCSIFDSIDELKNEVDTLTLVMNDFSDEKVPPPHPQAFSKIRLYNQLCNFADSRETLGLLRRTLGLKDYTIEFQKEAVEIKDEMHLQVIDESVIQTEINFLTEIAAEPRRRLCLQVFCDCFDVIKWIRQETRNLQQLKSWVQLVLQTGSGEGDLVTDMLTKLVTVGTAYNPLIYEPLPKDISNEVLAQKCGMLWKALNHTPNIAAQLTEANKHLEQYKHLKDTIGDIRKSTIDQMEAINAKGIYEVGIRDDMYTVLHSICDAVRLRIRTGVQEHSILQLSYLRELQGKLVLIAGSRGGTKVNQFLEILHMVQRIAELLVSLHQAGHPRYFGFLVSFGCAGLDMKTADELLCQMEIDLRDWLRHIQKTRTDYYWLNYYTMEQILNLRRQLGALKQKSDAKPDKQLLSLLQSVSPAPSCEDIHRCLRHAQKNIALLPRFLQVSKHHSGSLFTLRMVLSSLTKEERALFTIMKAEFPHRSKLVLAGLKTIHEEESAQKEAGIKIKEGIQREQSLRDWCIYNEVNFIKYPKDEEDVELPPMDSSEKDKVEDVIDANHPTVKLLMLEDEYEEDFAIKLVKKFGTSVDKARKGAMSCDDIDLASNDEWNLSVYDKAKFTVRYGSDLDTKVLDLVELGEFLREISYPKKHPQTARSVTVPHRRPLRKGLQIKRGSPNLIKIYGGTMWKTVLHLYMQDEVLPLPTFEEILICSHETTAEEVTLLWNRAVNDPGYNRIFCLVHAEKMTFDVCDQALQTLDEVTAGCRDYCIVILCCVGENERHHIISKLAPFQRNIPNLPSCDKIAKYLKEHFTFDDCESSAAIVDEERSYVRLIFSTRTGMGKSLYVQRLVDKVFETYGPGKTEQTQYSCIPLHGPNISPDMIVSSLLKHSQEPLSLFPQILHFDIAHSVVSEVDSVLFSILVLGGIADRHGRVWRHQPSQLLVIECTLTNIAELDIDNCDWKLNEHHGRNYALQQSVSLLSLLPAKFCVSPLKVKEIYESQNLEVSKVLMDEGILKSDDCQCVYQYVRRREAKIDLDKFSFKTDVKEGDANTVLPLILRQLGCENQDPSWTDVSHFIRFLSTQLKDCETSAFCNQCLVGDTLPKFKEFVVKFMLQMSQEFVAPSLRIVTNDSAVSTLETASSIESVYDFSDQQKWTQRKHPYLFFNADHTAMTFIGFSINQNGDLIDPHNDKMIIEKGIMTRRLLEGLSRQGVKFEEDYSKWGTDKLLLKLGRVLGCTKDVKTEDGDYVPAISNPDNSYVLTYDNVMKMLAIHMRFRCNIPVVMMGETGCGKTRLLQYLCDIQGKTYNVKNLICLKVHGGITAGRITAVVNMARVLATQNEKKARDIAGEDEDYTEKIHTVLFFDEANTTEALELIKEVMCDRRLNGEPITENVKFAAACNPYRRHTDAMLNKLKSAGLGFYDTSKIPTIGNTRLYELVYRVRQMPPSMCRLVYDFGELSGETENAYIKQIVHNQIFKGSIWSRSKKTEIESAAYNVFTFCQLYMRNQKDECSYVSLRDVVRALIMFEWFQQQLTELEELQALLKQKDNVTLQPLKPVTTALILAVAVCYRARLNDRKKFEEDVVKHFLPPYQIQEGAKRFRTEIERCEAVFLEAMEIPTNIANNAALRENVFMMVVCIENRLPLFLVGKPGSSKSLAKSIVINSMIGQQSHNKLLKNFKQAQLFPYQCSQFSTSESIVDVFEEAKKFQKKMNASTFVSVVVLEEVGLAEASPGLPLKTLHPYLEDGTSGLDPEEINAEEHVAFIGISNWALDPAKMNRGIMLVRNPPDSNELIQSAEGIAQSVTETHIRHGLCNLFEQLAELYTKIQAESRSLCDMSVKKREFFGLRDFYSLIKMLCSVCIQTQKRPTWFQLEHAIRRNFSGYEGLDPIEYVSESIKGLCRESKENELFHDCTTLGLIKTAIKTFDVTHIKDPTGDQSVEGSLKSVSSLPTKAPVGYENRYLLFLTENNSALRILQTHLLAGETTFVLYGSSFPKDQEYTQVCRNINQIKIHMETGKPVVLLNLENIYESLYDLLNQCYTEIGHTRYVDLGLRTHRIKCRVHQNFRLIIIAERKKVLEQFPVALINRLEKHFVLSSTILNDQQEKATRDLMEWAKNFATVQNKYPGERIPSFIENDAFVGFQRDTAASVILHASEVLKKNDLQGETLNSLCHKLLLQMASLDALARLKNTVLGADLDSYKEVHDGYFKEQYHASLAAHLKHYIRNKEAAETECITSNSGLLLQVTTYGLLLSRQDVADLAHKLKLPPQDITLVMLQEFETEMDFSRNVRKVLEKHTITDQQLLIIQCNNGHLNTDLIACARYRVIDEREKEPRNAVETHVVFIVQLPRITGGASFASFQGGPWISAHIDDLKGSEDTIVAIQFALRESISEFFTALVNGHLPHSPAFSPRRLIQKCIHKVVAELISPQFKDRAESLLDILLHLSEAPRDQGYRDFMDVLLKRICLLMKEMDESRSSLNEPNEWAIHESLSSNKLQSGRTLVNTLCLKLQQILEEILTYIVARADCNCNLDLMDPSNQSLSLSRLWLTIFADEIFKLQYDELFKAKNQPLKLTSLYHSQYKAQFPFSCEVIPQIEATCITILPSQGKISSKESWLQSYRTFCDTLEVHAIKATDQQQKLLDCYLNDFLLKMIPKHQEHTIELIKHALKPLIEMLLKEVTSDLMLGGIAAIHIAYHMTKTEIYWFTELVRRFPEETKELEEKSHSSDELEGKPQSEEIKELEEKSHSSDELEGKPQSSDEMLLHLNALKLVLMKFAPDKIDLKDVHYQRAWIQRLGPCKTMVESLLSCPGASIKNTGTELQLELRNYWQRILTVILYVEYVIVRIPSTTCLKVLPKRFYNFIKPHELSKVELLERVVQQNKSTVDLFRDEHKVLPLLCCSCKQRIRLDITLEFPCPDNHIVCVSCYDAACQHGETKCPKCQWEIYLRKKPLISGEKRKCLESLSRVQACCREFFMEFVSQICFNTSIAIPEAQHDLLIKQLLIIAVSIGFSDKYEEFFPIEEVQYSNKVCPIIRSFLLQYLLELSPDKAKEYLQEYFQKKQETDGDQYVLNDSQLCLLCVKSLTGGHFKNYSKLTSLTDGVQYATECFKKSMAIMGDAKKVTEHSSVAYLDSASQLQFSLSITAAILHDYYWYSQRLDELPLSERTAVQQLITCAKKVCEDVAIDIDLRHVLIKIIIRQYGVTCWGALCQHDDLKEWIMPSAIQSSMKVKSNAMTADYFALYGEDYSKVLQQVMYSSEDISTISKDVKESPYEVMMLLALFKHTSLQSAGNIIRALFATMSRVQECKLPLFSSIESSHTTKATLSMPELSPWTPQWNEYLGESVIHTIAVLSKRCASRYLKPLTMPILNAEALKETFIPTMPDEILEDISVIFQKEALWECPNGHKYFIGNCGRPWHHGKCPEPNCGADIGGALHREKQDNTRLKKSSISTQHGYLLGLPNKRTSENVSLNERDLSQQSCTILRFLIHASMFWSTIVSDEENLTTLTSAMSPAVKVQDLSNFFWHHLEKDLEILARLTERKECDAVLLVHLVLKSILSNEPQETPTNCLLSTKEARRDWERFFDETFIKPVFQNVDENLIEAQKVICNSGGQGQKELFKIVNEDDLKIRTDINAHLWSYHPRIGPKHLKAALSSCGSASLTFLEEFLYKEHILRAVQYLPGIAKLQRMLYELCNNKMDKHKAERLPMKEFMDSEEYVPIDYHGQGFRKLVEHFCKGWNIVKDVLPISEEYRSMTISETKELIFFIPCEKGQGVCSSTLAKYLASVQNDIIEFSWAKSDEYGTSDREYTLRLSHLQHCHVIDHEKQLEHLILSHCSYSLMAGCSTIEYDLAAIEKHVLDRFVHGKPRIDIDIPVTSFVGDVLQTSRFAQVRNNITQVALSPQHKQEIIAELNENQQLQDTIGNVNVALAFLTYPSSWKQNALLSRYIHTTLKLEPTLASKIHQYCTLGHVISLWKVLCVEQASKQLSAGENPFLNVCHVFQAPLPFDERQKEDLDERQKKDLERQKKDFHDNLNQFNLDHLLESFYEFIFTYVQYLQESDGLHEMKLVETFEYHRLDYKIDSIPNFEENFPDIFNLCHIVEIWKYIAFRRLKDKKKT